MVDELNLHGFDYVLHLAGPNEIFASKEPVKALDTAVNSTIQLVKSAQNCNVNKLINLSTIHVYGAPLQGNIDEELLPQPSHPYSIIKRTCEDYTYYMSKKSDMPIYNIRLSNAIGRPATKDIDRWTLLVNDLCKSAVEKGLIELRSDGSQLRDFISIDDVCRACHFLLESDNISNKYEIFNVGSGDSLSIIDMAKLIQKRALKVLRFEPAIILGNKDGTSKSSFASLHFSNEKIKSLGFTFKNNIEEEIDQTIAFCKKNFNG
jgi:UDP-glucose 4-epimerase